MKLPKIYLAKNLKYLRTSLGKTQEEIGKVCNKKNTSISNWEQGIRQPDGMDLAILASYFSVTIDDLMLVDLSQKNSK